MAFQPKFAKPRSCVTTFSSQEKFIQWLLEHKMPYREWGEKVRSKAWKEVEESDAVYYFDSDFLIPVRFICVITARVIMQHPNKGFLVLTEYVRDEDDPNWYKPRRQKDSSLSEKIILNRVTGEVVEKPIETIVRCLKQETGMDVSIDELKRKRAATFMPWHHSSGLIGVDTKIEVDAGMSRKREGLEDYRQVAHYKVTLSPEHYRTGYQDPETRYFARWHSLMESGEVKDIPAEEVFRIMKMERAAA